MKWSLLCKLVHLHSTPSHFPPSLLFYVTHYLHPYALDLKEEDSSSEDDNGDMCAEGEHKWSHTVCMICNFCGFCTGYGPGCSNNGLPGRSAGM